MPVRGHGDQVALLTLGRRRDFPRRLAPRQDRVGVEAFRLQPAAEVFEIRAVLLDLLRLPQVELVDVARHPPVRHVDEDERGAELLRQLPHVRQDGLVRGGVFERHEDPRIHQTLPRKIWTRSQALNPAIAHATTIWPASVPVSVEFCPDASRARANTALAPATPSSGVSSW